MARQPNEYTYNIKTLSELSGWEPNRIYQDAHREGLKISKLSEAVEWLAANGLPELRARLARRVLPVILGTRRHTEENDYLLSKPLSYDPVLEMFQLDRNLRNARAKKIAKVRRRKA
jgi:hypothetical protein